MINTKVTDFNLTTIQYIPAPAEMYPKIKDPRESIDNGNTDNEAVINDPNLSADVNILVVSDEAMNAEMIGQFLASYGYQKINFSHDIAETFEVIFHESPDVILYETNTITSTALHTLQRINENIKTSLVPLLILCAEVNEQTKLNALELGVVDVIQKPASEKELALRLRNILSVKTYHDQITHYDSLTKLPNLNTFISKLEWSLKNAKRHQLTFAVLQIHINGLGKINDVYGMSITDQLIKAVASRITLALRDSDLVAQHEREKVELTLSRVSGNQFSVLLPVINQAEDAAIVVKRLHEKIKLVYEIENRQIYTDCKTGIAIFPEDGRTHEAIMKAATLALHKVKSDSSADYLFYSKELNAQSKYHMEMENNLRIALDNHEFEIYFQPKISITTKRVIGAETLLRWCHPAQGFISPAEFIPIAEQTGHINQLGDWVIDATITQISRWKAAGLAVPRIALNISSHQFKDKYLSHKIERALQDKKLSGDCITIELTETAMMENVQKIVETLNHLKSLGIKISIDDFGTGYSSLVQLKELPLDEIKIDRTFTSGIGDNHNTEAIVTAIIALGRNLKLNIVAEGVETQEQFDFLDQHHCDEYQGYLFSPAITAEEFAKLIA